MRSWHGHRPRGGQLAALAVAVGIFVLATSASAGESFSYGGQIWHTYESHGSWYMGSLSDTFLVASGRVCAAFDTTLTASQIESIVRTVPGLSLLRRTPFNTCDLAFSQDGDPGYYAATLGRKAGVIEAVPSAFCIVPDATPNDTRFNWQWALHNTGRFGGCSDADVDAPEAWDSEAGDTTVVVAIIDNGADLDHPDLARSLWTNWVEATGSASTDDDSNGFVDDIHGYDFVDDDGDPEHCPTEASFHGTHIAGIVAAKTNNNAGVAGVAGGWGATRATGCKLMIVRIGCNLGYWDLGLVDDAIYYAVDNGANVISMSFHSVPGIAGFTAAANYAWSHGVFMVASTGNQYPASICLPAKYSKVMAVGADLTP